MSNGVPQRAVEGRRPVGERVDLGVGRVLMAMSTFVPQMLRW